MPRPDHSLFATAVAALAVSTGTLVTMLATPVAEADGSAAAHLLSCTGSKLARPHGSVVLACGDGNIEIHDTRWSSWTAAGASGTTTLDVNLCEPTCVQSKMRSFAHSRVRLSDVRRSSAGLVFARATITYKNAGKDATVIAYPRT